MSTKIEWTDETWNPLIGCSKVGPGCDHCYVIGVVHRGMSPQHVGLTVKPKGAPTDWTGEVREVPHVLDKPLHWKRPRRIFVNSLSDLFHPDVSDDYIAQVFAVMALAPQHVFQILTKRPQRMASWIATCEQAENVVTHNGQKPSKGGIVVGEAGRWPLPHVHLGVSIESDAYSFRADHLRRTPAAVRWVSAEPLLGPLPSLDLTGIDWVVAGGESGPGARPMHPDWARDLRDRCASHLCRWCRASFSLPLGTSCPRHNPHRGPAFLFKQWGSHDAGGTRMPKADAGRELDGRTWDEYPVVPA